MFLIASIAALLVCGLSRSCRKVILGPIKCFPSIFTIGTISMWKSPSNVVFLSLLKVIQTHIISWLWIETYAQVLCQSFRLLLIVILRRRRFMVQVVFWSNAKTNFYIEYDSLLTLGLECFCKCIKNKSSRITYLTVLSGSPSSFAILFADFRLILAINWFARTVLFRSEGVLADITSRVIRAYHLYTVALDTVLLSLPKFSGAVKPELIKDLMSF